MSPAAELPAQRIQAALEALRHTQGLLLEPTPRNIDICCTALAVAARHMEPLLAEPGPHRNLPQLVAVLHNEVSVIAKLLEHAAAYHTNLLHKMIEAARVQTPAPTASAGTSRLQVDA